MNPTINNNVITIKSPNFKIRGSGTYLNNYFYGMITDIRYQWICELYRIPVDSNVVGWEKISQIAHAEACLKTSSHTLT